MNFGQLLGRADEGLLQQLLGPGTVRLLDLLDSRLSSPRKLRELVSQMHAPEELLRDANSRRALLGLLPLEDASRLASALGDPVTDPYTVLFSTRFAKNSSAEWALFRELGVLLPPAVADEATPSEQTVPASYGLFVHQRAAASESSTLLKSAPNRMVLHMPTGSGKTRTAMHLVCRELEDREPSLVVWLAFSEELCEQSAGEFEKAWSHLGNRPVSVYRYWGNRNLPIDDIQDGFVVAGLAKTYQGARRSMDFITRLADRSTMVIIDEAHQAVAETYRTVLDVLVDRNQGTKLLGLTATPGRSWNEPAKDRELADFFAGRKVTLKVPGYASPVDYLIHDGYLARPTFETLTHVGDDGLTLQELSDVAEALEVPEAVLQRLAASEQRNLLIIRRVEQLLDEHMRTIVFAATVAHARLIATVLRARGVEADVVTASTAPGERSRIITRFRSEGSPARVLVNFGVLTTGFDAPRTSAAVIARPTKSLVLYSQMVGRATRGPRAGGNSEARIVTVVDRALPGFGKMSEAFENWEDVW